MLQNLWSLKASSIGHLDNVYLPKKVFYSELDMGKEIYQRPRSNTKTEVIWWNAKLVWKIGRLLPEKRLGWLCHHKYSIFKDKHALPLSRIWQNPSHLIDISLMYNFSQSVSKQSNIHVKKNYWQCSICSRGWQSIGLSLKNHLTVWQW